LRTLGGNVADHHTLNHLGGSLLALAIVGTIGCHNPKPLGAIPSQGHAPCNPAAAWDTLIARNTSGLGWPSMRLAVEVPEFGSAYVDTVLKVYLTDLNARDRARAVIDRFDLYGRRGREVRFIQGKYSYRDLQGWGLCMLPYYPRGVASFGVWERDNRDMFTVVNDDARKHLEIVIERLGIPREAFIIKHGEYAKVLINIMRSGWGTKVATATTDSSRLPRPDLHSHNGDAANDG
jgi:hypothetical protein